MKRGRTGGEYENRGEEQGNFARRKEEEQESLKEWARIGCFKKRARIGCFSRWRGGTWPWKGRKEHGTFGRRYNEEQELFEEDGREQGAFSGRKEDELGARVLLEVEKRRNREPGKRRSGTGNFSKR